MSKIQSLDSYVPLVAETSARSKVLLELGGSHVIFYVSATTNELRARAYGTNQTYVLLQGVLHCHGVVSEDVAYIYAAMATGTIRLMTFRHFGEHDPYATAIALGYNAVYLHVIRQDGHYLMALDNGAKLMMLTADDPAFLTNFQSFQIYSNTRDPIYRMSKPVLGIHPEDYAAKPLPTKVTVGVERLTKASGVVETGFLVVDVVL